MTDSQIQRLFIAVWPNPVVSKALQDLQVELELAKLGRPTPVVNLHITLLFLGEVPKGEVPTIKALVEQITLPPVSVVIDRIGFWPHNNIVWAGPIELPAELVHLSNDVQQTFKKFVSERRKFTPHVTLARKVRRRVHAHFEPITWAINEISLVQSTLTREGAQYRSIAHSNKVID